MRLRRVPAPAFQRRFENIHRGHHRSGAQRHLTHRQPRPVVQPKHRIHRKALEQAVVHHRLRAGLAFFCGLEYAVDGAVEIPMPRQMFRRRQQHHRVAVVTTGVHHAGAL